MEVPCFLIGLGVGVALTLLFAPASGNFYPPPYQSQGPETEKIGCKIRLSIFRTPLTSCTIEWRMQPNELAWPDRDRRSPVE